MANDGYGLRIVAARRGKNMQQAELAASCEVTQGTVSRWEAEQTTPSYKYWKRIAPAVGSTAEWLMWGDQPPKVKHTVKHNIYMADASQVTEISEARYLALKAARKRG